MLNVYLLEKETQSCSVCNVKAENQVSDNFVPLTRFDITLSVRWTYQENSKENCSI